MFKFSAVSQIWKKYIQKLNDWDLPLKIDFLDLVNIKNVISKYLIIFIIHDVWTEMFNNEIFCYIQDNRLK